MSNSYPSSDGKTLWTTGTLTTGHATFRSDWTINSERVMSEPSCIQTNLRLSPRVV